MRTESNTEKPEGVPIQDAHEFPINVADENPKVNHQHDETAVVPLVQPKPAVSNNGAYENNEFAGSANFAKLQNGIDGMDADHFYQTPFILSEVYQNLPKILTEGCHPFTDDREKDVFLTGALCILSGCMPGITGIYAREMTYPNLYCFIIAPAASGKGALKFSKDLGDKIHERILKESREAKKTYQAELERYQDSKRSKRRKGGHIINRPDQPPEKVLFIPANCSYAKVIWHLKQNEEAGIICETEADTMSNVLKQEWGSYSDLLRKAFHHESLSSSKKTENEYNEIDNPRLSIALSGTPSQILGLIKSSEDGLFSRFIFYAFTIKPYWKDVSPRDDGINLNDYFEKLSYRVLQLYDFSQRNPASVELTDDQWDRLKTTCQGWLEQTTRFNGDESSSVVHRIGIILFRIAMILTAIRRFEQNDPSHIVTCTDEDFETAVKLSKVYLSHSIFMFNNLPQKGNFSVFKGHSNKQRFFDDLPHEFKRSEAVALGTKYGLKERTVDGFLNNLLGQYLKLESFGKYSKIIDEVNNVTNKKSII